MRRTGPSPGRPVADLEALGRDALAEHDDLRAILVDVPPDDWERPTPAAGWTIRDQISHLAYFDGAARLSMADPDAFRAARVEAVADIEKFVEATLAYGRGIPGAELPDRFAAARPALVEAPPAAPRPAPPCWWPATPPDPGPPSPGPSPAPRPAGPPPGPSRTPNRFAGSPTSPPPGPGRPPGPSPYLGRPRLPAGSGKMPDSAGVGR